MCRGWDLPFSGLLLRCPPMTGLGYGCPRVTPGIGASMGFPVWVGGTQVLGPSLLFLRPLTVKCTGTGTDVHLEYQCPVCQQCHSLNRPPNSDHFTLPWWGVLYIRKCTSREAKFIFREVAAVLGSQGRAHEGLSRLFWLIYICCQFSTFSLQSLGPRTVGYCIYVTIASVVEAFYFVYIMFVFQSCTCIQWTVNYW